MRVRDETLVRSVALSWPSPDHHDEARLTQMYDVVERLQVQAADADDIQNGPFRLIASGDWSPNWETQIARHASNLSSAAMNVERECDAMLKVIGARIPDRTIQRLDCLKELAEALEASWRKQTAFALEPDGGRTHRGAERRG